MNLLGLSLWDIAVSAAFLLLVAIPTALSLDELPHRVRSIRRGRRGLLYVPFSLAVLVPVGIGTHIISQQFTFLQWGWLGTNIVGAPIISIAGDGSGGLVTVALIAGYIALMLPVMMIYNYLEEEFYRDSWWSVVKWAGSHVIMGIPIYAVITIFSVGVVYKFVHDRKGLDCAYVTHLATNCTLFAVILILLSVSILGV